MFSIIGQMIFIIFIVIMLNVMLFLDRIEISVLLVLVRGNYVVILLFFFEWLIIEQVNNMVVQVLLIKILVLSKIEKFSEELKSLLELSDGS